MTYDDWKLRSPDQEPGYDEPNDDIDHDEDDTDYEDALRHGDLDEPRDRCVLGEACLVADPFHSAAECFDVEMAEAFMGSDDGGERR